MQKTLPKDGFFQIWQNQSPMTIAQHVSFVMLNNFYV